MPASPEIHVSGGGSIFASAKAHDETRSPPSPSNSCRSRQQTEEAGPRIAQRPATVFAKLPPIPTVIDTTYDVREESPVSHTSIPRPRIRAASDRETRVCNRDSRFARARTRLLRACATPAHIAPTMNGDRARYDSARLAAPVI